VRNVQDWQRAFRGIEYVDRVDQGPRAIHGEMLVQTTSQGILDAALNLPEPERVFIVQGLIESLGSDPAELDEELTTEELDRRLAEFEQGTAGEIPWSELKRQK